MSYWFNLLSGGARGRAKQILDQPQIREASNSHSGGTEGEEDDTDSEDI